MGPPNVGRSSWSIFYEGQENVEWLEERRRETEARLTRLIEARQKPGEAAPRPRSSKGPSPATVAAFTAFLHYHETEGIKPMPIGKLAQKVAEHAHANRLPGHELLSPTSSPMREWAKLALVAMQLAAQTAR
jgi:hypothetical protein